MAQSQRDRFDSQRSDWGDVNRAKIQEAAGVAGSQGFFTCKCGSRNTTFYEMQTRSADEPMTQFITCLDCKNKWRQ